MKVVAISDLHGFLPRFIEPCDVLIIAGDIIPGLVENDPAGALRWLDNAFRSWLEATEAEHIVGIAGNHDTIFEDSPELVAQLKLPWHYLLDEGVEIAGINFWGLPWVPNLPGWAFNASAGELADRYARVPSRTDVVISHGPPYDILDRGRYHYGAPQANDMIARVRPQAFICGHVHEGYGHRRVYHEVTPDLFGDPTDVYNVAHCNIKYHPVNRPVTIEVPGESTERLSETPGG